MKIAIISGSHRNESQSGRIAEFMAKRISELKNGTESYILDLGKTPLPLWDESMWGKEGDAAPAWKPVSAELQNCDAVIVIAAEWNGTAPAALKNFFHYASGAEFGHKAGLLVGVSASLNGAYPIAEMRATSAKNCKLCYIPDHLIIRHAGEILHDSPRDEFGDTDAYMRERIDYTLGVFFEYSEALAKVRASGKTESKKFSFGM